MTNHPKPILNQPEMEWGMLHVLYEASRDWYRMAQRMAPKIVTLWAWALLFHGERFKIVEC